MVVMDELSLIVEGLGYKVKKLLLVNKQLRDKILRLEEEKAALLEKTRDLSEKVRGLEDGMARLQAAKALKGDPSGHARQRINELLREIDKCQALLNS